MSYLKKREPEKSIKKFIKRNINVKIKLKSFEMAAYFLNSAKHITLLESDAEFCSLFDPNRKELGEGFDSHDLDLLLKSIDDLNIEPYY